MSKKDFKQYTMGYKADGSRKAAFESFSAGELYNHKEPMDFLHKATGYTLSISQQTIPVAGFVRLADVTEFWDVYQEIRNDKSHPIKISFNTLMLRVCLEGIKADPIMSAHLKFNTFNSVGSVDYRGTVEISMPVILPDGRMIPLLLHDMGNKNLDEIAYEVSEIERKAHNTILDEALFELAKDRMLGLVKHGHILKAAATGINSLIGPDRVKFPPQSALRKYRKDVKREDRITGKDIGEGSVCISDVGSIYSGRGFATTSPILQPTTSVMAYGRVYKENKVYKDENGVIQLEERKILPFTLLFDHKIGGFPDIVPFLNRIDDIFANPEQMRNW